MRLFSFTGNCFPEKKKMPREDAHCGVKGRCRKRPPQARECAKAHSFLRMFLVVTQVARKSLEDMENVFL